MSYNAPTQWTTANSTLLLGVALAPRDIGLRIKAARERKHWTQHQFATEANVSMSTISRWETGNLPPVRELIRVAGVLEIEPEQLVEPPAQPESFTDRLRAVEERLADSESLLRRIAEKLGA